jgi:hypothetical protein
MSQYRREQWGSVAAKLYTWDLRLPPPLSTGVCCLIGFVIDPEDGSCKFPGIVYSIIRLSDIKAQKLVLFKLHRHYNNVINMCEFFNSDQLHESHHFIVIYTRTCYFQAWSAAKENVFCGVIVTLLLKCISWTAIYCNKVINFTLLSGVPQETHGEALSWAFLCARNDGNCGKASCFISEEKSSVTTT